MVQLWILMAKAFTETRELLTGCHLPLPPPAYCGYGSLIPDTVRNKGCHRLVDRKLLLGLP